MPLIAPIIHCNGTSAESLKESLADAYSVINTARSALRFCRPNGRDYYPQPGLMTLAEEQHARWEQSLADVMAELEQVMDAIDAQVNR